MEGKIALVTGASRGIGQACALALAKQGATVIGTALRLTHGRRIEAATKLGLGRNTITRKIQELKLEED